MSTSKNQTKVIAFFQDLVEEEVARGQLDLRLPPADVAYAIVRLANAFLWTNLIAGEEPDIATGVNVARAVLT